MDSTEIQELGRVTAKYKHSGSEKVRLRRFKSHFGTPPEIAAYTWELLINSKFVRNELPGIRHCGPNPVHMLWALMLLKRYDTMEVLADHLKIDEDTLRKWSHFYLEAMAELDADVVSDYVLLC